MLRCAEIDYRTRTHQTRDLQPAGFPVPVTIPHDRVALKTQWEKATKWLRLRPPCLAKYQELCNRPRPSWRASGRVRDHNQPSKLSIASRVHIVKLQ